MLKKLFYNKSNGDIDQSRFLLLIHVFLNRIFFHEYINIFVGLLIHFSTFTIRTHFTILYLQFFYNHTYIYLYIIFVTMPH